MSDASVGTEAPFLPTVPDEEYELRALVQALGFAEKFSLLFVRCNQPAQRQRLMAAVQKQLPQMVIQEIRLHEPVTHLLDAIRQQMTEPPPDAIFVSGVEHSLPLIEHAAASPFVANLNVARDLFARDIHCPLVLWVPEYVLATIMQGAPDFFSIRSGVFSFVLATSESAALTLSILSGTSEDIINLPVDEKYERIRAIKALLSDYQSLPSSQRDHRTEAQLLNRLGSLLFYLGNVDDAGKDFHHSLEAWGAIGDCEGMMVSYHKLGMVASQRGSYDEAVEWYSKSLAIAETMDDWTSMADLYHKLGMVALERGAYDKAVEWYGKSLAIAEKMSNRGGIAGSLHNLGIVAHQRGAYDEALALYQKALAISEELGNREDIANSYHELGVIAQERGAYDEAFEWYRKSLAIMEELGNRRGIGITYGQMAKLLTEHGKVSEAILLNLRSLVIHRELHSPNVDFNLRLLQWQREQLGEERFLTTLRKHCDEATIQQLLGLLAQNRN